MCLFTPFVVLILQLELRLLNKEVNKQIKNWIIIIIIIINTINNLQHPWKTPHIVDYGFSWKCAQLHTPVILPPVAFV
jgi:hypothetical protein